MDEDIVKKAADVRMSTIKMMCDDIHAAIKRYPESDLFGMVGFMERYRAAFAGFAYDDLVIMHLTHCYMREVLLVREGKVSGAASNVKTDPSEAFLSACRGSIAALMDVPEAGGKVSEKQENQHLDSAMAMTQALKAYEK